MNSNNKTSSNKDPSKENSQGKNEFVFKRSLLHNSENDLFQLKLKNKMKENIRVEGKTLIPSENWIG